MTKYLLTSYEILRYVKISKNDTYEQVLPLKPEIQIIVREKNKTSKEQQSSFFKFYHKFKTWYSTKVRS